MIKIYPTQNVCSHRIKEVLLNTMGGIGAIYEMDCSVDNFCPNQPERSKREDLHHKDCIPWIKHNCWHGYDQRHLCEYKEDCDNIVGARMRCSEHCRNAVRDK